MKSTSVKTQRYPLLIWLKSLLGKQISDSGGFQLRWSIRNENNRNILNTRNGYRSRCGIKRKVFIHGMAGERFAVRNSGATAVIEGVGDHCCEYMTGGRVVVLGKTGRNFAAGMSGGVAYVLDEEGDFDYYCNMGMVELSLVEDLHDKKELTDLIARHYELTGSKVAEKILEDLDLYMERFIKVIPYEYKKVMQELELEEIKQKLATVEKDVEMIGDV